MMTLSLHPSRAFKVVIAAGIFALGLSACSENGTAGETSSSESTSKPSTPTDFTRTENGGFLIGASDAPVTVIEYASYTCGHCAHFHEDVLPKLKEKYIDTGKVRFEMRSFSRNEPDFYATLVIDCAGEGRFEPMTDLFFSNQQEWLTSTDPNAFVETLAKQAGFSSTRYQQCVSDEAKRKQVLSMTQEGLRKYRIQGTPTVIVNGDVITYRNGWEDLDKAVQEAL